jgi:post-segregation antitoxin (ccd killing protein)
MAKRKITVTVDAATLEQAQALGVRNLSAVVDEALEIHVRRLARRAALQDLLDEWEREAGPVPEADRVAARAAFDELDDVTTEGRRTA